MCGLNHTGRTTTGPESIGIGSAVYYHTDHDTVAVVPAAGLEAVARAYAKIIDQVNKLDRSSLMPTAPKATSNRQGQ